MKKKRCIKLFAVNGMTGVTISRFDKVTGEWTHDVHYSPSEQSALRMASVVYDRVADNTGFLRPFLSAPGWIYYEL